MDIQKYGFYLGLGGALAVYLLVYWLLVSPYGNQISKSSTKLKRRKGKINEYLNKQSDLPNDKIIAYHRERREKLRQAWQKALKFYRDKDQAIEKWFDLITAELKESNKKLPELDFFQVVYTKEKEKLLKAYANKKGGLQIGKIKGKELGDFADLDVGSGQGKKIAEILPLVLPRDIVTNSQMKKVQKQYWFIKYFLEILEKGKMQCLTKFKFLNQWQDGGNKRFVKRSIELEGQIDFGNIPYLLQEILNNPYLMTEISRINIGRDNTYRPERITVPVEPWRETEDQALEKYLKKNPGKVKLPAVNITLRCDVLDYQEKKK